MCLRDREWTAFRMECVRRRTYYDLHGKEKRLHLLQGLAAILLDIDKAIKIIRTTEEESEVVPNPVSYTHLEIRRNSEHPYIKHSTRRNATKP